MWQLHYIHMHAKKNERTTFSNYKIRAKKVCTGNFDIHMSVHHNIIPNYSQQDAMFLN